MGDKKIKLFAARKNYDLSDADKLPTIDIPAVEIFAEGTWNGDAYSAKDLDDIVAAFSKVGFKPPIKAGHEDGQEDATTAKRLFGEPALGYVSRIYRQGKKLLADLIDVPRAFANLIKSGAYRRISSEIYWNYKNEGSGSVYPRVLKAVSFLGANIPALTGLKEIESLYKKNAAGYLYSNDGAGNEFRLYDRDYQQNVMFGPVTDFLLSSQRKTKVAVNFNDLAAVGSQCGGCKFFVENINCCTLVEGYIEADDGCDLFEADDSDSEGYTKEGLMAEYAAGGSKLKVEKQGNKFCVVSSDGKTLGCKDNMPDAMKLLGAEHAKMMADRDSTVYAAYPWDKCIADQVAKGSSKLSAEKICGSIKAANNALVEGLNGDMELRLTVAEMEQICPSCADKMKAKNMASVTFKDEAVREFMRSIGNGGTDMDEKELNSERAKLAQEREQLETDRKKFDSDQEAIQAKAKEDAEKFAAEEKKENEQLRERVAEMERKHEHEQLAAWISKQKADKKLIPVEETRLVAIFTAIRGMPKVVKFSEGGKEVEQTPEEALKAMIEARKPHQLFTEFSRHEGEPESYATASDEVNAKAKAYMAENKETDYSKALRAVLNADPALNHRYMSMQQ